MGNYLNNRLLNWHRWILYVIVFLIDKNFRIFIASLK